jgi:hypothetical protein
LVTVKVYVVAVSTVEVRVMTPLDDRLALNAVPDVMVVGSLPPTAAVSVPVPVTLMLTDAMFVVLGNVMAIEDATVTARPATSTAVIDPAVIFSTPDLRISAPESRYNLTIPF